MTERARNTAATVIGVAAAALCAGFALPAQGGERLADHPPGRAIFRDLAMRFDPAMWDVSVRDERITAVCRPDSCRYLTITGSIEAAITTCSEPAPPERVARRSRTVQYRLPGLALFVTSSDLGCRNLVPARVTACIAHNGRIYRFDAGPHGCRQAGPPGNAGEALRFLKGLSAR